MSRTPKRGGGRPMLIPILIGLGAGLLLAGLGLAAREAWFARTRARATPAELAREIAALRGSSGASDSTGAPLAAALHARLDHAAWQIKRNESDWDAAAERKVRAILRDVRGDLAAAETGRDVLASKAKPFLCGYWSEIDDTVQPFAVALPKGYDPEKRWPLLVALHGQGLFRPFQCRAEPEPGMIVVAPHGRGGMDYKWVGEGDVLRVIEEAKRLFSVDDERVHLAGHSMGGTGAWHLATRYPDRFAAILATSGNTDVSVWAERWDWTTPEGSPQRAVREFLRHETGAVPYAENLLHVAVTALQGEEDPVVDKLHAERMVGALRRTRHPRLVYHLLPLVEHRLSVNRAKALAPHARTARPERVVYRTAWLKHPGAYWVRVLGIERRLRFARVEAEASARRATISVETENVTRLALDLARTPLEGAPRRIRIDGRSVEFSPEKPLVFEREWTSGGFLNLGGSGYGPWKQAEPVPRGGAWGKTAALEGPVEDAFTSRFLVVRPTKDSENTPAARAAADAFCARWRARFGKPPRAADDAEVTDADIADSNLILYGGPEENALAARVSEGLPIRIEKGMVWLGRKTYSGANAGVKFCRPNPLNPRKYVVLIAGATAESYADEGVRFGNWFDWIPYDGRAHYDYAVWDDRTTGRAPETFLVWGLFGERWEFDAALRFEGDAALRARVRPRAHPKFAAPPRGCETVFLDEVAAKGVSLAKEYLERNRSLNGGALALAGEEYKRGLAFRWPGSVSFETAGCGRLRATAGIQHDGASEPCGDRQEFERAVFVVRGDGGRVLYESEPVQWSDAPVEIDVDVSAEREVTLAATGGRVWLNTTAVWAGARLEGR